MNTERNWYGNIIAWFAHNSVAANLLMICLLAGGLFTALTITKEIQPRIETNYVTVSVPYRGGTPRDVEQGVLIKIEEAIQDLEGLREIISTAREGSGTVTVEVDADYDVLEVLDNIKGRVDSISTFPAETERPTYQRNTWSQEVIWVSVFGDVDQRTLKEAARQIRDDITALPSVTRADLTGALPYEIGIEVQEETLRAYDMTLGEVAQSIRESSMDLPGGRIQAPGGDVLLALDRPGLCRAGFRGHRRADQPGWIAGPRPRHCRNPRWLCRARILCPPQRTASRRDSGLESRRAERNWLFPVKFATISIRRKTICQAVLVSTGGPTFPTTSRVGWK